MSEQNINHARLHLDEKEAIQLARAVQILLQDLGFDPEEVNRSYKESLAYFLKNDHIDQGSMDGSCLTGQASMTA